MYRYRESSNLKSLSVGILLTLTAYYAVIVFHLNEILKIVAKSHYGIFAVAFFMPGLIKGGLFLKVYRRQKSLSKALRSVTNITYCLIGIAGTIAAMIFVSGLLSKLLASAYWSRAHWFWISILLFLLLGYSYLLLNRFGLVCWKLIADLKAIPIVSPIFCFGGPFLWSKNLGYASLDPSLLSKYSTITIISGVVFLCYLLVFAVLNHRYSETEDGKVQVLYDSEGKKIDGDGGGDVHSYINKG